MESSSIGHEASAAVRRIEKIGARQVEGGQRSGRSRMGERKTPGGGGGGAGGDRRRRRRGKKLKEEEREKSGARRETGRFSMVKSRSARGRSAVADEPRLCKVPRRAARAALQRSRQTAHRLPRGTASSPGHKPRYQEGA